MARHRRHHRRRHYGDALISMPSLSGMQSRIKELNPLGKHVNSTDLFVGAGIAMAGGAAVKYLVNMVWAPANQPAFVQSYSRPLFGITAGALAALFVKNRQRAAGYFAGAAIASIVPTVWSYLASSFPAFADAPVGYPSYAGLLRDSPQPAGAGFGGLLTASPQPLGAYGEEDPAARFG